MEGGYQKQTVTNRKPPQCLTPLTPPCTPGCGPQPPHHRLKYSKTPHSPPAMHTQLTTPHTRTSTPGQPCTSSSNMSLLLKTPTLTPMAATRHVCNIGMLCSRFSQHHKHDATTQDARPLPSGPCTCTNTGGCCHCTTVHVQSMTFLALAKGGVHRSSGSDAHTHVHLT